MHASSEIHIHTHALCVNGFMYIMHRCFRHTHTLTHTHTNKNCISASGWHPVHSQVARGSFSLHANCNILELCELESTEVIYAGNVQNSDLTEKEREREMLPHLKTEYL